MKLYRFKTFTTSYYFPELTKDLQYMYGLYSAYGGKLSKIYWALFRKCKWIRRLTTVNEKNVDFPYATIKELTGNNSTLSFNMGSPGIEQKISILGNDSCKQEPFFAKFAQKEAAKRLSRNEIHILRKLADTGLAPALMDYKITDEYVFLKTECIKGKRPKSMLLTQEIVEICICLSKLHLTGKTTDEKGLSLSLSHGDFCPWNFLEDNNKNLRLIDWEMAEDRPLGYDLFTYIFHTAFLFNNFDYLKTYNDNRELIEYYFNAVNTDNARSYLKAFAKTKSHYECQKDNTDLAHHYAALQDLF